MGTGKGHSSAFLFSCLDHIKEKRINLPCLCYCRVCSYQILLGSLYGDRRLVPRVAEVFLG